MGDREGVLKRLSGKGRGRTQSSRWLCPWQLLYNGMLSLGFYENSFLVNKSLAALRCTVRRSNLGSLLCPSSAERQESAGEEGRPGVGIGECGGPRGLRTVVAAEQRLLWKDICLPCPFPISIHKELMRPVAGYCFFCSWMPWGWCQAPGRR